MPYSTGQRTRVHQQLILFIYYSIGVQHTALYERSLSLLTGVWLRSPYYVVDAQAALLKPHGRPLYQAPSAPRAACQRTAANSTYALPHTRLACRCCVIAL